MKIRKIHKMTKITLLAILFSLAILLEVRNAKFLENFPSIGDTDIIQNVKSDEGELTVHVVPHTHDDAGWNWTFDEYYLGTNFNVSVKKILDNFVNSLYDREDRTFIYVETGFFVRWYKEQTEEIKEKVKNLLKQRRFEFINGGYVMHDEAASYYQHTIDQMRLGLLFLKEEFDFVPEIAWFIDPFGHSASNAYILSKMGFKKIAIVRIDSSDKEQRKQKKTMEFYWVPFNKFDNSVKIFTHVTYNHYCSTEALDHLAQDIKRTDENIEDTATKFLIEMKQYSDAYRHKHIMVMYGCDFSFNKRDVNYENLEMIMDYINAGKISGYNTKVKYSLPSKYFEAIFNDVETWPSYENDDFFPYADSGDSVWTGYFTSRPYLKGMVREAGNYLIVVSKIIFTFIFKYNSNPEWKLEKNDTNKLLIEEAISKLFTLREKLAICQHHDAVAGTAREYVSQDYIKMLEDAVNDSKENFQKLNAAFNKKIPNTNSNSTSNSKDFICIDPVVDHKCLEKQLESFNENENLLLEVKNLNQGRGNNINNNNENLFKSFEINEENEVQKQNQNTTQGQSQENNKFDTFCINELKNKTQHCKVYFKEQRNFVIQKKQKIIQDRKSLEYLEDSIDNNYKNNFNAEKDSNGNPRIYLANISNNKKIKLTENISIFKENSNSVKFEISTKLNSYNITAYHAYYESYNGKNSKLRPDDSCPSGAYILSTTKIDFDKFELINEKSYFEKGNLVSRVVLRFEKSYLILTMDNESPRDYVEFESIWDPIPEDAKALEYLLVVDSDIDNEINLTSGVKQSEFWTDSNGIKMMRRIKDFRSGYDLASNEDSVAANFYPVNSMFSIREKTSEKRNYTSDEYQGLTNENKMVSYMVDRSQSIGSIKKGQIISIQNRQSYTDDRKGMTDWVLKEGHSFKINFKVKSYLVFDNNINLIKKIENKIQNRFALLTSIVTKDENKIKEFYNNINIRSFKRGSGIEYDLRFMKNFYRKFSNRDKNLIMNIHILSSNKVFLQFFNNCDMFHDSNCAASSVNLYENNGIKIREYSFNGISPLNKEFSWEQSKSVSINPFDFKLFLVEFTGN
jgi:hypothetical protein